MIFELPACTERNEARVLQCWTKERALTSIRLTAAQCDESWMFVMKSYFSQVRSHVSRMLMEADRSQLHYY